ncbi:MAG: DUF4942 domain-containing protein [Firmicutes bacterium]|nr:DUF4942 domain-containing protein [Bacillota bacterium]
MFDNFYPTPPDLISKMLSGLNTTLIQTILEPSAGKGDLAEAIKQKFDRSWGRKPDIDCIEIQPELQHILKGKKFRVISDDFLAFSTQKQYDLILMNPPFDEGDKHLQKALELQENGGHIICILNAETIKNPYTNTRKALKRQLEDYAAEITYIKDAFVGAERATAVEVALIKVAIPKKEFGSKILDNLRKAPKFYDEVQQAKYVARFGANDFLDAIVEQYNFEAQAGINLLREYYAMQPLLMDRIKKSEDDTSFYPNSIIELRIKDGDGIGINAFVKKLRYKYWEALFSNPKFVGRLTQNLQTELFNRLSALQDYDFSIYNIMTIKEELLHETIRGVEETILKLYEDFSHKYHWADETSKNIHYFNGWKTNKAWKINKKVIIPLNGFDSYDQKPYFRYTVLSRLSDVTKVFDYLDSGRTYDVDIESELKSAQERGQTSKIKLKYFTVTFYKKGTCHIEFTDLDLLDKFNLYGCQRKGWLPPHFGKKRYKDMDAEEQEVAKAFSGSEAEYNKIYQGQDFYLVESNSPLLLAEKF